MQNFVIRYILIFSLFVFGTNALAATEYSNELLKIDINQTSEDSVKVNIYTDKPYKDKIIVNKRPDNKYVILLPETANSVTTKPDISGASMLNNVEVKTQQYSSLPDKAYTKITIDGKKPLEIVPQAFTTKKATSAKRSTTRPYLTPQQVQTAVPQRILNQPQQRPVVNSDFVPSYERQRQLNQQQQNYVTIPQQSQPSTYVRREQNSTQYEPQTRVQNIQQTLQTTQNSSAVSQNNTKPEEDNNNNNTVTETQSNQETATNEEQSNQAIDDAGQNEEEISEDDLAFFKKLIKIKQKIIRKIKKLLSIRISLSSFLTVLQLILLVVLVKIISDLVKKIQGQNEKQPLTKRLIHDSDEAFEQGYPTYSNMDVYNTNRSNFEEDSKQGFNVTPISAPASFTGKQSLQNQSYVNRINKSNEQTSIQNNFYKPFNEINEEERMSIFDENSQDIEKTIFKNPLTQISKQEEDTLFDEFEPAQENTPFTDKDNQDDFFNYVNQSNNDEDFFIFEDENEEEAIQYQEDYIDEDEDEDEDYEYEDVDNGEYEETDDNDENYEEDIETEQSENYTEPESNPLEHLTVISKYIIDSNRGFAQVNVDGINALIGYVGSKVSVIRKFKEDIQGTMQVRLNEQPAPDTMIYIIKVGSFKTLVEVKPNSIRQLLDL